jgi:hypothetical protein
VDNIHKLHILAKRKYDQGEDPIDALLELVLGCLQKVKEGTKKHFLVSKYGKEYWYLSNGTIYSRPFLPALFNDNLDLYKTSWELLIKSCDPKTHTIKLDSAEINKTLYTAIMSFSICYDLWKTSSRKTPGTFFEVLLGSLISLLLPEYKRMKHIPLPQQLELDESCLVDEVELEPDSKKSSKRKSSDNSVSTDIVFTSPDESSGIVIPAKITTRERIVQPFAHQRILDSIFGEGKYKSILACVSEMQRDGLSNANEICVPGTIKLFQKHLAQLSMICYLDPPLRYLHDDLKDVLPIISMGELLSEHLAALLLPTKP